MDSGVPYSPDGLRFGFRGGLRLGSGDSVLQRLVPIVLFIWTIFIILSLKNTAAMSHFAHSGFELHVVVSIAMLTTAHLYLCEELHWVQCGCQLNVFCVRSQIENLSLTKHCERKVYHSH